MSPPTLHNGLIGSTDVSATTPLSIMSSKTAIGSSGALHGSLHHAIEVVGQFGLYTASFALLAESETRNFVEFGVNFCFTGLDSRWLSEMLFHSSSNREYPMKTEPRSFSLAYSNQIYATWELGVEKLIVDAKIRLLHG